MVLLIDNYDSFVFNLARYFAELGCHTEVVRNDRITVEEVSERAPQAVVLSPGPCTPAEAGICIDLVRLLHHKLAILGVCLGHQAIVAALGGQVTRATEPVHGRCSPITHSEEGLFQGMSSPLTVARYHSLKAEESSLPPSLSVAARTADGTIMAVQHRRYPVYGVQFHPESVLTRGGHRLLGNFLRLAGLTPADGPEAASEWSPPVDVRQSALSLTQPLHW